MQKFVKKDDLIDYLIKENLPNEIYYEATFYMETVQECNDGGAGAMLVISPMQVCDEQENELGLEGYCPEQDEKIYAGGEVWRKRIYVFCNDGTGVVLFERLSPSK